MKPCSKYHQDIALLAIHALDSREEQRVQSHLKTCACCREYGAEMARLSRRLETVELRSDIVPSASFQMSLARRLLAAAERPAWSWTAAWRLSSLFNWRVAAPILTASLLLVAVLPFLRQRPRVVPPAISSVSAQSLSAGEENLTTMAGYQLIANRSPDALDELMVKQGNRNPPIIPALPGRLID